MHGGANREKEREREEARDHCTCKEVRGHLSAFSFHHSVPKIRLKPSAFVERAFSHWAIWSSLDTFKAWCASSVWWKCSPPLSPAFRDSSTLFCVEKNVVFVLLSKRNFSVLQVAVVARELREHQVSIRSFLMKGYYVWKRVDLDL